MRASYDRAGAAGLLFLLLVTVACCLPALDAPFTHDEEAGIDRNRALRPGSPLGAALAYRFSPDQWRPVFFASLWADAQVFGTSPRALRALSLLPHLLCGTLVYLLLRRAAKGERNARATTGGALAGAALFLLHPLQSESILYVWGRSGVLATLFALAALALFPFGRPTLGAAARTAGAIGCAALALGAKEEAVALAPFAFVFWTAVERREWRAAAWRAAVLALPAVAFVALRPRLVGTLGRQVFARSVGENILAQAAVTLRTLRMVLLPAGQSVDHAASLPSFFSCILAVVLCVAALAGAVTAIVRLPHGIARIVAAGAVIFASTSALYWIVPLPDLMAERRAYMPMIGVAIGLAALVTAAMARGAPAPKTSPAFVLVPAAILTGILAPLLTARAVVWSDPRLLWEEAAQRAPGNVRPPINLGVLAATRGDQAEARVRFNQALAIDPRHPEALYNRGTLRLNTGDLAGAESDLAAAVAAAPARLDARVGLALARLRQGRSGAAEADLRAALAIDPDEPRALTNLAEIVRAEGRTDEAIDLYRRALAADPAYAHAAVRLAVALEARGDRVGALGAYREYLRRGPASPDDARAVRGRIARLEARGAGETTEPE